MSAMGSSEPRSRVGKTFSVTKFGCFKTEPDRNGNFDMEVVCGGGEPCSPPSHLVVMVNGIVGSADNWKFAAKQFLRKYPNDVIVHCSKSNSSMLTFDGVDIMGDRLADEVISVINRHSGLERISFVGHSLGGLVVRYAIARLYEQDHKPKSSQVNGVFQDDACGDKQIKGRIAGLEPINFIAVATPHLGSRWHKQVPLFCGFRNLEKFAARASWLLGRTGKQLFLTDHDNGKPPLLLQMVSDGEDLKFISALQSFKRRVVYANAGFDHLVGWCTSSLRHPNELRKCGHLAKDEKYPHIVNVEAAKIVSTQQEIPLEAEVNEHKPVNMKEEMLRALTKLSWERIDVNFRGSKQRLLAHSTIQVKHYFFHSDGADVVQHMVDCFIL